MFAHYLLLLLAAVIYQSSATEKDFVYVVDNAVDSNSQFYPNPNNGFGRFDDRFDDLHKIQPDKVDKVKIQLYYECLCPGSRQFTTGEFKETVKKLDSYLDVLLYPYGNAKTSEHDGHISFTCQHGAKECYGNKLHACALYYLKNVKEAVFYNSCMMDGTQAHYGSDDDAADVCGHSMDIDSTPIKKCAKGARGDQLLKFYGEESKKANFTYVPYVLINGLEITESDFMQDVCKAFKTPPPECKGHLI